MKNIIDFCESKKGLGLLLNNNEKHNLNNYQDDKKDIFIIEGIRGGCKTYIGACIVLYEVYKLIKKGNVIKYYGFPRGEQISLGFKVINNTEKEKLFSLIRSMVEKSRFFKKYYRNNNTVGSFSFKDKKGNIIRIIISSYDEGGACGQSCLCIILDDFEDSTKHNEVFKAFYPCISVFGRDGRVIKIKSSNS